MAGENQEGKRLSVRLVEERGVTSRFVDAAVEADGMLVLSGQDVGKAPREHWGDDDYEFVVSVLPQYKDVLLLALIEHAFGGHFSAVDEFRAFLKARDIPCEFWSWV